MTVLRSNSPLRTEIAGVSVTQLTEQYGTPVYIYDSASIIARIEELRAFDEVRYAQKACSNLAIVDLIRRPWLSGGLCQCR